MHLHAPVVLLSTMVLLSFLYLASRISQSGLRRLRRKSFTASRPAAVFRRAPIGFRKSGRPIRRITIEQFKRLLDRNPNGLIVLDLRSEAQWVPPFPLPDAMALPVTPTELLEILGWLPANRSVVFYGACAPWISAIEKYPSRKDAAPFYLLEDRSGTMEAA